MRQQRQELKSIRQTDDTKEFLQLVGWLVRQLDLHALNGVAQCLGLLLLVQCSL